MRGGGWGVGGLGGWGVGGILFREQCHVESSKSIKTETSEVGVGARGCATSCRSKRAVRGTVLAKTVIR